MESKLKFELNDELLDAVSGGATISTEVPPEAKAEGLDFGVEVISEFPCDKCGCERFRCIDFTPSGFVVGECVDCKRVAFAVLKSYGGAGWELA